MGIREQGIENARRVAKETLLRFGGTHPDVIDLDVYAAALEIEIEVGWVPGGAAVLVRGLARTVIRISSTEVDEHTIRWSLAHEIAHFVLGHPTTPAGEVLHPKVRVVDENERDFEAEANAFTSEFLMPRVLARPLVRSRPPTLEPGHALSRSLNVSILAASRRVAELSKYPCAAVFSIAHRVVWVQPSNSFNATIRAGHPIEPGSVASQFFAGDRMIETPQSVSPAVWGGPANIELVEHAIASPRHGTVLSMVWIRRPRPRA